MTWDGVSHLAMNLTIILENMDLYVSFGVLAVQQINLALFVWLMYFRT